MEKTGTLLRRVDLKGSYSDLVSLARTRGKSSISSGRKNHCYRWGIFGGLVCHIGDDMALWVANLFVSNYHESSRSVWEHSCKQQPAASQGTLRAKQIKSPWKRLILFKCPWYCLYKIILNVNSTAFVTVTAESWTNLSSQQSLIYLFRRGS